MSIASFDVAQYGLLFRMGLFLIYLVLNVVAGSFGLWLASKWIKGFNKNEQTYGFSLFTLLKPLGILAGIDLVILLMANYIPIVSPIVSILGWLNLILVGVGYFIYVIKKDYEETWANAILTWLTAVVVITIAQVLFGFLLGYLIINFI